MAVKISKHAAECHGFSVRQMALRTSLLYAGLFPTCWNFCLVILISILSELVDTSVCGFNLQVMSVVGVLLGYTFIFFYGFLIAGPTIKSMKPLTIFFCFYWFGLLVWCVMTTLHIYVGLFDYPTECAGTSLYIAITILLALNVIFLCVSFVMTIASFFTLKKAPNVPPFVPVVPVKKKRPWKPDCPEVCTAHPNFI